MALASAASAWPQSRGEWYDTYAEDTVPYSAPVVLGATGHSSNHAHTHHDLHSARNDVAAAGDIRHVELRRQEQPVLPASPLDFVRNGLKDIGEHVVGGFSRLTGIELVEPSRAEQISAFSDPIEAQPSEQFHSYALPPSHPAHNEVYDGGDVGYAPYVEEVGGKPPVRTFC